MELFPNAAAEIKLNCIEIVMKRNCLSLRRPRDTKGVESREKQFRSGRFFPLARKKREDEGEEVQQPSGSDLAFLIARRRRADEVGGAPTPRPTALSVFACRSIAPLSPFLATADSSTEPRGRFFINENSMEKA